MQAPPKLVLSRGPILCKQHNNMGGMELGIIVGHFRAAGTQMHQPAPHVLAHGVARCCPVLPSHQMHWWTGLGWKEMGEPSSLGVPS